MNLGISNTQVSTWKRIKTQHIVAAAGIALAVSAVIGGVALRNDSATPVAPTDRGSATIQTLPQAESLIYIVASQAEAAALQAGFNETASLDTGDLTYRHVLVVDSLEAEASLQAALLESVLAGNAEWVRFADLRAGTAATPGFGATASEPAPSAFPLVQEISNP